MTRNVTKYFCDYCGKEVTEDELVHTRELVHDNDGYFSYNIEICHDCADKVADAIAQIVKSVKGGEQCVKD